MASNGRRRNFSDEVKTKKKNQIEMRTEKKHRIVKREHINRMKWVCHWLLCVCVRVQSWWFAHGRPRWTDTIMFLLCKSKWSKLRSLSQQFENIGQEFEAKATQDKKSKTTANANANWMHCLVFGFIWFSFITFFFLGRSAMEQAANERAFRLNLIWTVFQCKLVLIVSCASIVRIISSEMYKQEEKKAIVKKCEERIQIMIYFHRLLNWTINYFMPDFLVIRSSQARSLTNTQFYSFISLCNEKKCFIRFISLRSCCYEILRNICLSHFFVAVVVVVVFVAPNCISS